MIGLAPAAALADTYTMVDFSGAIDAGPGGVLPPLDTIFPAGAGLTGHFVIDDQLRPGPGSGHVNVLFNTYPQLAAIPSKDAFDFDTPDVLTEFELGANFDLLAPAATVYDDGHFAGFRYVADFAEFFPDLGQQLVFQFRIDGDAISIFQLDTVPIPGGDPNGAPTGAQLLAGHIAIGDQALTNAHVYTGAPEPGVWALMVVGFGSAGALLRRRPVRALI
jgi:hypothetical protein